MVFVMQSDLLHHTMSVSENHVWHGVLIENIYTEYNYSILVIKRLGKLYGFDPAVDRSTTAAIAWFVSGGAGWSSVLRWLIATTFSFHVNGCSGLIWMAGQWLYCPAMIVA